MLVTGNMRSIEHNDVNDWAVFRDNPDENACCLIQECSPVWVALPHQNAPHRILDQPLPDAFRSPSPMLESSTVHGVSSRSVMTGSPLPGHATPVPRLYFTSATDSTSGSSPNTIAVAFSLRQT